ncbi:sentrin-specific protease 6 isoform X2 [Trichomycterus rosablanca]|uniref:sentrin-specific protease 6 isoform X2 n=1 Tax=Trichomycterus rosablanca TaxID=2290929 RepID=UPI002F35047A
MAHKKSIFIEALDRSEASRDGGYKQNWSFSLSDDSEEEKRSEASLVTMDQVGGRQELSPEGIKAPPLRHFRPLEPVKTYERRSNHLKSLNRVGTGKPSEAPHQMAVSPLPNKTNFLIMSSTPPQGVVVQGRLFQHTHLNSSVKKPVQSNLDFKERSDFNTQRVDVDKIILTCPEIADTEELNVKRLSHSKRRALFEGVGTAPSAGTDESIKPEEYLTVCRNCGAQSEDHTRCKSCSHPFSSEVPLLPAVASSPAPRVPLLSKSFYGASSGARSIHIDTVKTPPALITRGTLLLPHNGANLTKGKRQPVAKQNELNDPIVLSSDEDDEADSSSTGSVNRLDSVSPRPADSAHSSPRPADSAHSSPAPSGGRVEAAVKGVGENEEQTCEFFIDMDPRNTVPRRNRTKDQVGNAIGDDPSPSKKRKVSPLQVESMIMQCRSVRIGTLRRMVTKPVIFTIDYIQLETEGQEIDVLENVRLKSSELTSCEWCSVRKLPVIFFQTSANECQRLRSQLQMSQENGVWYDCAVENLDEKYIVLIFETGPSMKEQMMLEDILVEIGKNNKLLNFPARLTFDDANVRLVQYNKASKEKEMKAKSLSLPPSSAMSSTTVTAPGTTATAADTAATATTVSASPVASTETMVRTRSSTQRCAFFDDEEEEDMSALQPTFTGPIIKLIVYPPPPAKGGISVTNEDLHCLNDGEFLNDVIIDFYLKYLFMEKLKKEDAQKSHVFSSFFYKRLNQRERRNAPDTSNLPIPKRKHNRVKTWTRHVDLFQKDFIFVPINESAHWYLAVICFPGLEGPHHKPNPLYQPQSQSETQTSSLSKPGSAGLCKEDVAEPSPHTEPISFSPDDENSEGDGLGEQGSQSSMPPAPRRHPEHVSTHCHRVNGQVKGHSHYIDGLHRIGVCYSNEEPGTFSDDQSSSHDECSEDGALAEEAGASEGMEWTSKPTICKQPCILIMDSLRGPARSTVVKTLREYLEVEWEVKKGTKRSFGKDVVKGSSPRVPQQDNFSDCGVYVLQYVESFFENPLPSFHLPMNLLDWFPQQRMKTKRDEIKDLILKLQSQQQSDRTSSGQDQDMEDSSEDLDVGDAVQSADLIPPISS